MDEFTRLRAERMHSHGEQPELFQTLSAILFAHDPMRINFRINADEYDPEVGTILPRLPQCESADDILQVVLEEFRRWFAPHKSQAADPRFQAIAQAIWAAWQAHHHGLSGTR